MKKKKRGGKKNRYNVRGEYKKSWRYLKESRNFIYIIMGVFFAFTLAGFFLPVPGIVSEYIKTVIQQIITETEGMNQSQLILFIFFNNAKSSLVGMVLGIFFGIFPLISTIMNGYLLGFVSLMAVEGGGWKTLLNLLPHGIFELPAVFISLGMGLKLSMFIFQKNKGESFREYLWSSLRVFLFIVLPLLIIAAIIEGSLIFLEK